MHPIEESGEAERRLHQSLMQEPRRRITENELEAVEDLDARDNYRIVLRFRDRLLAAGTLEACYLSLFRDAIDIPPLFIAQMAHVILRNALDGCDDGLTLRAAELFFREQKATIRDGHALVADLETVERHAVGSRYGALGRLIVEAQGSIATAELDVLERGNAALYWERESKHDTVISLTYGGAALDALCRVIGAWIAHLRGIHVSVRPLARIEEAHWAWHIGLDAESTALLNELWQASEVEPERMRRLLALFALQFNDPAIQRRDIAGRAVYLALCCDADDVVRMKPQNLLVNLPLNEA